MTVTTSYLPTPSLKLGGRFDGFFNVSGKVNRDEVLRRVQGPLFFVFVHYANVPVAFDPRIGKSLINFSQFERRGIAFVPDANDKLLSSIASHLSPPRE
jgi:hypothetical protein